MKHFSELRKNMTEEQKKESDKLYREHINGELKRLISKYDSISHLESISTTLDGYKYDTAVEDNEQ